MALALIGNMSNPFAVIDPDSREVLALGFKPSANRERKRSSEMALQCFSRSHLLPLNLSSPSFKLQNKKNNLSSQNVSSISRSNKHWKNQDFCETWCENPFCFVHSLIGLSGSVKTLLVNDWMNPWFLIWQEKMEKMDAEKWCIFHFQMTPLMRGKGGENCPWNQIYNGGQFSQLVFSTSKWPMRAGLWICCCK